MTEGPATLENRTFDEITVGDSANATKTLTRDDIALFTAVWGAVNPIHLDERLAEDSPLRREVGHSLWGGGQEQGAARRATGRGAAPARGGREGRGAGADGEAEVLMKGSLHTDELMGAVVRRETGLRTERRVSHCFIMDVPSYPKPLVVTDAAINIFSKPDRDSATRPPARRIHGSPASAVMSIPPSAVGDGSAVGTSGWPLRPQRRPGRAGFRGPSSRATERTR
jgi:hypothetical protein